MVNEGSDKLTRLKEVLAEIRKEDVEENASPAPSQNETPNDDAVDELKTLGYL